MLACFSSPLFQRAWFLRGMAELLMDSFRFLLLLLPGRFEVVREFFA